MIVILILLSALSAFAQVFQYRVEGSFQTNSGAGTPGTPSTVNYSVNWNETADSLQGLYRDNFFASTGPSIVTGSVSPEGRKMNVILPGPVNGVKLIALTANNSKVNQSTPVKVVTMNNVGTPIDSPPVDMALLTAFNEAIRSINTDKCSTGFGVLSGYCGVYDGTMYEASDAENQCNLLTAGNPRLEVGEDTVIKLYLNYIQGAPNQSSHTVGALPPSPQSNFVDISSRNCSELPGTEFGAGNCRTLNLNGDFQRDAVATARFTGTYTITDEVTGESCSYTLNLTRGN